MICKVTFERLKNCYHVKQRVLIIGRNLLFIVDQYIIVKF